MNFIQDIQRHQPELEAAQKAYGGVYIAIMPNDDEYDLEIETSSGTIAITLQTHASNLKRARAAADKLASDLEFKFIHVYPDRKSWEKALERSQP